MSDDGKPMACPNCGETDRLATVEELQGLCEGTFYKRPDGTVRAEFGGETDILWETSRSVALVCRNCLWENTELEVSE